MTHILFVCHGNICRSPMAEFIMKDLIRKAGCEKEITVDSVAATTEEIGHDMYPPAKRMLTKKGIPFTPRRAASSRRKTTSARTTSSAWMKKISTTSPASRAVIRRRKSPSSSPGQDGAAKSPIPGIPETSKKRMTIS